MDDINALPDQRFELLSAYLDEEVTAEERKQVEDWLATDPEFQALYLNLCRLQYGLRSIPTPHSSIPVEQTVDQVIARASRKPHFILWGGVGVAAAVIGVITSLLSGEIGLIPRMAQDPIQTDGNTNAAIVTPSLADAMDPSELMIALDQPPVDVPIATSISTTQQQTHSPDVLEP